MDLQAGQNAILRELNAIKALLTGAQPTLENVRISTGVSPFLGSETARVAIRLLSVARIRPDAAQRG